MRNRRAPRTEPCGTPDLMGFHDEVAPFKTIFAFYWKDHFSEVIIDWNGLCMIAIYK